jgi:hypothetical protein
MEVDADVDEAGGTQNEKEQPQPQPLSSESVSFGCIDVTDAFWRFVTSMNAVEDTDDVLRLPEYEELCSAVHDGRPMSLRSTSPGCSGCSGGTTGESVRVVFDDIGALFRGARLMAQEAEGRAQARAQALRRCMSRMRIATDAWELADGALASQCRL